MPNSVSKREYRGYKSPIVVTVGPNPNPPAFDANCVHITGDVCEGYTVKASKGIYIGGNAYKCKLMNPLVVGICYKL